MDWLAVLIGAAAPIVAFVLSDRAQTGREGRAYSRSLQDARRERLRELYTEAMALTVAVTPQNLGYRFPSEDGAPDALNVDVHVADRFRARLMVELAEDEDPVLKAFIGVVNFSTLYRLERAGESAPNDELRKTEQLVRENVDVLQRTCRERLRQLET